MIYAKRIVPALNIFYKGHFQDTPNVKTFFGYATLNQNDNCLQNNFLLAGAVVGVWV